MCDLAYLELQRRLAGTKAASRSENVEPVLGTQSTGFSGVSLEATAPPSERDQHIQRMFEWSKTDSAKTIIAGKPSALATVSKAGEMRGEVRLVQLMLGRCKPRIVDIPGVPVDALLVDLLENDLPPLTSSEEAARKRLLSTSVSAKGVVDAFLQETLRKSGLAEWVLFKRQDRAQIAKCLVELAKDERAYVQVAVVELAGELLRTWGNQDAAASQEIVGLLQNMLKKPSISWAMKVQVQQALQQRKL
jgi:hypothetical protein